MFNHKQIYFCLYNAKKSVLIRGKVFSHTYSKIFDQMKKTSECFFYPFLVGPRTFQCLHVLQNTNAENKNYAMIRCLFTSFSDSVEIRRNLFVKSNIVSFVKAEFAVNAKLSSQNWATDKIKIACTIIVSKMVKSEYHI